MQEFRLRHQAAAASAHNHLMVTESYQSWVKKTLDKHGLEGCYTIDVASGEIRKHG